MTYAYHEVDPAKLNNILAHGLRRSTQGSKSQDEAITKTDKLLDKLCPDNLRSAGVSRENNLYAYLVIDNKISDITTGQLVDISEFISKSQQGVVRLTLDPDYCFVSDLDAYDNLKLAVEAGLPDEELKSLANHYWASIRPFNEFKPYYIKRPEIMITYNINPHNITATR